ncbi:MAG TPA: tRNA lysidine(34) synthetase TilS, partial [Blastocatellia bacterium]|nr:tRNA lysidine(34) synthetase TilS [Blastocatellia bacterium]
TAKNLPAVRETVFVGHFNHLLRGEESDLDEQFVCAMADSLAVDVIVEREDVAAEAKSTQRNLEAVARSLRYSFLERTATKCKARFIATAHNFDDQVETILHRLIRGSSAVGLRGIHPLLSLNSGVKLIRPLLDVTREEVLAHCAYYQLDFRVDSSNASLDFTRNRIRHELIPLLKSFNPRVGEALIRTTTQAGEDDLFLQQIAIEFLQTHKKADGLELRALRQLPLPIRRRVVREWLKSERGDLKRIEAAHLMMIDDLIMHGEGGSYIELPDNGKVERKNKFLRLENFSRIGKCQQKSS